MVVTDKMEVTKRLVVRLKSALVAVLVWPCQDRQT